MNDPPPNSRERERACKRDYQRRITAERRAANLCRACGKPANSDLKGFCKPCGEKHRERGRKNNARLKTERAAQGRNRKPPCTALCPECKTPCVRRGHTDYGIPQYSCKKCGRLNLGTGIRYRNNIPGDTYRLCLNLNQRAEWGLLAYRIAHACTYAQAIRAIFTDAAHEPAIPMCSGRSLTLENGKTITRTYIPKEPKPIPHTGPLHLRDLRPETRAYARKIGATFKRPFILIVRRILVTLDGIALTGLLKKSRAWNRNYQQTARDLLARHWIPPERPTQ